MPPAKISKYADSSSITDAAIGPMVWTGYLLRRFQCDLDALNTQLPIPIETDEEFEFGINPRPLPRVDIPQLFQRFLYLGSNPDGNYTREARYSDCDLEYDDYNEKLVLNHDSKSDENPHPNKKLQFNLYKRVIARVPESKYWLFKELKPYLSNDGPPIETSVKTFIDVMNDLELELVECRSLEKWNVDDRESLLKSQAISLLGLSRCELPETLALLFSIHHLAVWQNVGFEEKAAVIKQLGYATNNALTAFVKSTIFNEIPNGEELAKQMYYRYCMSTQNIEQYGMRSIATRPLWLIPKIPNQVIIVKQSIECNAAMRVLQLAGERWYEGFCPEKFSPYFVFPNSEDVTHAITVLAQSAIDVSNRLELRAIENLKKFDRVRRHNKRSLEM